MDAHMDDEMDPCLTLGYGKPLKPLANGITPTTSVPAWPSGGQDEEQIRPTAHHARGRPSLPGQGSNKLLEGRQQRGRESGATGIAEGNSIGWDDVLPMTAMVP